MPKLWHYSIKLMQWIHVPESDTAILFNFHLTIY